MGCSTGTQAELDLGSFLRSSWKYFRSFLRLFLYTKHTSRPILRGPRLLLFAFLRLPSSRWKSQSDQHRLWFYFELCQVGKKIHDIQWQSMALSHWSSGLQGSVKSVAQWCIMSHTKACLCSCRCFHLHTGLLLHLSKFWKNAAMLARQITWKQNRLDV